MQYIDNVGWVFGSPDENTLKQMARVRATGPVLYTVLCADAHYGYSQPIGGVVAYDNAVSPSGVGYDISCGIRATLTNMSIHDFNDSGMTFLELADEIAAKVSFGVGRKAEVRVDHELFDDPLWKMPELSSLKEMAQGQLGTVGSGNHFVDVLADENGYLWVMAHFGSRGFGHKVASGFLNLAANRAFFDHAPGESMDQPPTILSLDSDLGQYYWEAMELAGQYAYAGRDAVVEMVIRMMGAKAVFTVHNHHNYAWREKHFGQDMIVVRKGATPAFIGQWGAVGGSMGDRSVILRGAASAASRDALYSTMHGAGRVMSRTAAAGKVKWLPDASGKKRPQRVGVGLITKDMMRDWLDREGVVLRGADVDEAPQAYRRLTDVVAAHQATIEVVQTLQPLVVVMAGSDTFDPYKD